MKKVKSRREKSNPFCISDLKERLEKRKLKDKGKDLYKLESLGNGYTIIVEKDK